MLISLHASVVIAGARPLAKENVEHKLKTARGASGSSQRLTPAPALNDNSRRAAFFRRRARRPATAVRPLRPVPARSGPAAPTSIGKLHHGNPSSPLQTLPGKPTHQLGQAIAQLQALRRQHAELSMLDAVIDDLSRCHQSIHQIASRHLVELDAANSSLAAALQLLWQCQDDAAPGNHLAFMLEPLHAMQLNAASELNRLI